MSNVGNASNSVAPPGPVPGIIVVLLSLESLSS